MLHRNLVFINVPTTIKEFIPQYLKKKKKVRLYPVTVLSFCVKGGTEVKYTKVVRVSIKMCYKRN